MKTWNIFDTFSKNTPISSFMKIRPVVAKLFHANKRTDGLIDMTTTVVAFRSFANAPKNGT